MNTRSLLPELSTLPLGRVLLRLVVAAIPVLAACAGDDDDGTGPASERLQLSFVAVPSRVEAGDSVAPVRVAVVDAAGAVRTSAAPLVKLELAGAPAGVVLEGVTEVRAVSGVATFERLVFRGPAESSFSLRASAPGMTAGQSGAIRLEAARVESAELLRILKEVDAVSAKLPRDSVAAHASALAAYLRGRPDVDSAGVSWDHSVWAVFAGGVPVLFAYVQPPRTSSAAPAGAPFTVPAVRERSQRSAGNEQDRAYVIDALAAEGVTNYSPARIAKWLQANGYSVAGGGVLRGTLEDFTNIKDAQVVYLATHGAIYQGGLHLLTVKPVVADEPLPNVQEARGARKHVPAHKVKCCEEWPAEASDATPPTVWAVSQDFVRQHWTLRPNSLVYADACVTFNPSSGATDFVEAVFAVGAGSYLGWTGPVRNDTADHASALLFDRVLGMNAYQQPEKPPLRPFDIETVHKWMEAKGHATDTGGRYVVRLRRESRSEVDILRPYIIMVEAEENLEGQDQLEIYGEFGAEPGTVTIDDGSGAVPLKVQVWRTNWITAELPRTGAGSVGDVVVTVRGHASNPRRLSVLKVPLSLTMAGPGGSLALEVEMDLIGRFEPGMLRAVPEGAPDLKDVVVREHATSAARYRATGEWVRRNGSCTITQRWSGSGTVRPSWDEESTSTFSYLGRVDVGNRALLLDLMLSVPDAFTVTEDQCGSVTTESFPLTIINSVVAPALTNSRGLIDLSMDDLLNLRAGQVEGQLQAGPTWVPSLARLRWPAAQLTPVHAPGQARD